MSETINFTGASIIDVVYVYHLEDYNLVIQCALNPPPTAFSSKRGLLKLGVKINVKSIIL